MHPKTLAELFVGASGGRRVQDYARLVRLVPSLEAFVKERCAPDDKGFERVEFDFENADAVRALQQALLKVHYSLNVSMPTSRLMPTVILRVNYIHWLEDLLAPQPKRVSSSSCVRRGIDIGTGATCIYPLLGARLYQWHFLATEADEESFGHAQRNVSQNSDVASLIHVRRVHDTQAPILLPHVDAFHAPPEELPSSSSSSPPWSIDFTMCNPPFYDTRNKVALGRALGIDPEQRTRHVTTPATGILSELATHGGEVSFITRMIKESLELDTRVCWYTSMVGKRCSLRPLDKVFRRLGIDYVCSTEFAQGTVVRYAVAWTHSREVWDALDESLRRPVLASAKKRNHEGGEEEEGEEGEKSTGVLVEQVRSIGGLKQSKAEVIGRVRSLVYTELGGTRESEANDGVTVNEDEECVRVPFDAWKHARRKRRALARTTETHQHDEASSSAVVPLHLSLSVVWTVQSDAPDAGCLLTLKTSLLSRSADFQTRSSQFALFARHCEQRLKSNTT